MLKYLIVFIIPISLYSQIEPWYADIMRSAIKADGITETSSEEVINLFFSEIKATKKCYSIIGENSSLELIYIDVQNVDYKMLVYDGQYFFRVKGFKENDYIHFYNFIMKHNLNDWKKQLNSLYQCDTAFSDIDFDCLNISVKTRKNNSPCMESYVFKNPKFIHVFSVEQSDEQCFLDSVYSYFSNKPYYGCIPLGWRK